MSLTPPDPAALAQLQSLVEELDDRSIADLKEGRSIGAYHGDLHDAPDDCETCIVITRGELRKMRQIAATALDQHAATVRALEEPPAEAGWAVACRNKDAEIDTLRGTRNALRERAERAEADRDATVRALGEAEAERDGLQRWQGIARAQFDRLEQDKLALEAERDAHAAALKAARLVYDTFVRDEADGYRSRDRQFAIDILGKALTAALAQPHETKKGESL